jgi:hypothetical protein
MFDSRESNRTSLGQLAMHCTIDLRDWPVKLRQLRMTGVAQRKLPGFNHADRREAETG